MKKIEDVSSRWFDYYSLAHVAWGHILFIVFSLKLDTEMAIIGVMASGLAWEIFENYPFLKWKFEGKRDSLANSLADICFWTIGGIISVYVSHQISGFLIIIELAMWVFLNRSVKRLRILVGEGFIFTE